MPVPRRAVLAAAAVVAIVLVVLLVRSCGDDSLSPDELRTQASAICVRVANATDRVAVPNAPAGGARFLSEGLALMRPAVRDLRALKAPDTLRDDYERAVGLSAQELAEIARAEQAIRGGDDVIDTFRTLQQDRLAPILREEDAAWRALRIPACVRR